MYTIGMYEDDVDDRGGKRTECGEMVEERLLTSYVRSSWRPSDLGGNSLLRASTFSSFRLFAPRTHTHIYSVNLRGKTTCMKRNGIPTRCVIGRYDRDELYFAHIDYSYQLISLNEHCACLLPTFTRQENLYPVLELQPQYPIGGASYSSCSCHDFINASAIIPFSSRSQVTGSCSHSESRRACIRSVHRG